MQALPECLELSHSLHNFTLGNKNRHIMKTSADKGNSEGGNNMARPRKASSKNSEIEAYLSKHYEFRYNTVLGRTEYRRKSDCDFVKVGRYEINTLRREIDNDISITTSSDNLYSIIESSVAVVPFLRSALGNPRSPCIVRQSHHHQTNSENLTLTGLWLPHKHCPSR